MPQRTELPTQKRLQILDDAEIEALYERPQFTSDDRLHYFRLTQPERDACASLRSHPSQLFFMLQLAYFKAKQLFFTFTFAEVGDDLHYLLAQEGRSMPEPPFAPLNKRTILHHRQLILDLFRYRACSAPERQHLATRARQAARMSSKPIYVFRELLQYLFEQRIVLPGYTVLQELVGKALTAEQQRLMTVMQMQLEPTERAAFDTLFADTDGLYLLTQLKHEPKDFSVGQIREEIRRGAQLRPLDKLARRILPQQEISNEGIQYYDSLVS